jgi:hypothetical protein
MTNADEQLNLRKESETAVPDIVSEPQPAAQQQQQIQPKEPEKEDK